MAKLSAAELGNISKINLRGSSLGIKSVKEMNASQKEKETRALSVPSVGMRPGYDNLKVLVFHFLVLRDTFFLHKQRSELIFSFPEMRL